MIIDVQHYNCSVSGIFSCEIRLGPFFLVGDVGEAVLGFAPSLTPAQGSSSLYFAVHRLRSVYPSWFPSVDFVYWLHCNPTVLSFPNLYPHPQEEKSFPFSSHASNTLKSTNIPERAHQYEHLKPAEALLEMGIRRELPCCPSKRTSVNGCQLTLWISSARSHLSTEPSCRSKIWTPLGRWY